jgi:hypothetical protein
MLNGYCMTGIKLTDNVKLNYIWNFSYQAKISHAVSELRSIKFTGEN